MRSDQMRAARALLRWSQQDLADKSGVSAPTIKRLEAMEGDLTAHNATIQALALALETAGVQFIPENGGGAGVRLARRKAPTPEQPSEGEAGIIKSSEM